MDGWDLFYEKIPSTTPHFSAILKFSPMRPLSPFVNQPDFETVDPGFEMSMNMHDNEPPLSNVDSQTDVLQQSDAPTLPNLPAFNQGEQPDWRQPKAV